MLAQVRKLVVGLVLGGLLAVCAAVTNANAHAVIIESSPAIRATLSPGPLPITLKFNSRIDHARSRLTLVSSNGTETKLDIVQDSPADIVSGITPALAAGEYRLRWQVLAIDGHLTRGDIPFSVNAP